MQYDLIILGSGSVGAAAGYYARKAGLNVLMTDAHMPPHQQGSHAGGLMPACLRTQRNRNRSRLRCYARILL